MVNCLTVKLSNGYDSSLFWEQLNNERQSAQEQRARNTEQAQQILDDLFPEQSNLVLDRYPWKSLRTPRRAGKSHVAIAHAFYTGLLNPGSMIPVVALTLKSSLRLYWEMLKGFIERYQLRVKLRPSEQAVILENSTKIFFNGAETIQDIEKLRGGSYILAIVDECKSIPFRVFEELIDEVLTPATGDCGGTILVIGTPGSILDGEFYKATCPKARHEDGTRVTRDFYKPETFWDNPNRAPAWNRHYWTVKENTFRPDIWERALLTKKRKRWENDNPVWLREYLGHWVPAPDSFVYALQNIIEMDNGIETARCLWRRSSGPGFNKFGLSTDHTWEYVLGMDIGFEDAFAMVVVAYSPTSPVMYHVHDESDRHLTVSQIAARIRQVERKFSGQISAMVADTGALGKLVVESLNQQHGFYIIPAEKREKYDHIELLNSDLYSGQLKVLYDSGLADEWRQLQWDLGVRSKEYLARSGKLREDRSTPNHISDAMLYTWRYCYHHFSRPEPEPIPVECELYWEEMDYKEALVAVESRDSSNPRGVWTDSIYENYPEDDYSWLI